MKIRLVVAVAFAGLASAPAPALAGIYGDDLTRCIVKSTTDEDQLALVKWIFGAMAMHPSIKSYSNIRDDQRAQFDAQVGVIVTRLLTETCRKETVDALKYEGTGFLEKSFSALGEVAMGGLMTNPEVAKGIAGWAKNLDKDKLAAVAAEAGRAIPPTNK